METLDEPLDPCQGLRDQFRQIEEEVWNKSQFENIDNRGTSSSFLTKAQSRSLHDQIDDSSSSLSINKEQRNFPLHQRLENNDTESLGASTISTLSAPESVFDRLYRNEYPNRDRQSSQLDSSFYSTSLRTPNTQRNRIASSSPSKTSFFQSSSFPEEEENDIFHRVYKKEMRKANPFLKVPKERIPNQRHKIQKLNATSVSTTTKPSQLRRPSEYEKENSINSSISKASSRSLAVTKSSYTSKIRTTLSQDLEELEKVGQDLQDLQQTEQAFNTVSQTVETPFRNNVSKQTPAKVSQHMKARKLFSASSSISQRSFQTRRSNQTYTTASITHASTVDKSSTGFFTLDSNLPLSMEDSSRTSMKTPRRQRYTETTACIKIQSSWRAYCAKLRMARLLLDSWEVKTNIRPTTTRGRIQAILVARSQSRNVSVTNVHSNRIEWKTEHVFVQVRVQETNVFLGNATLFVRAAITEALLEAQGKLYTESSQVIQQWIRKRLQASKYVREEEQIRVEREDLEGLLVSFENDPDNESEFEGWLLELATPSKTIHHDEIQKVGTTRRSNVRHVEDGTQESNFVDERIASIIHDSFSLPEEKSPESQRTINEILGTFRSLPYESKFDLGEARQVFRQSKDLWQPNWSPYMEHDKIKRQASSMAIHNIVQAYLQGLRRYRRSKMITMVQASYRRHICVKKYQCKLWAARQIQFAWKRYLSLKQKKISAMKIQGLYKMKVMKNRFELLKFATIVVQSQWRKWQSMHNYKKTRKLALWSQRAARGYISMGSKQRTQYLSLRSAVVSLQRIFRVYRSKHLFRLQMKSAIKIQRTWRMSLARQDYLVASYSIVKIQSLARWKAAYFDYQKKLESIRTIQIGWRRHLDWKRYGVQALEYKLLAYQSVFVIQSHWRKASAQNNFEKKKVSTLVIQTQWRKHVVQKEWLRLRAGVIALQSVYRGYGHRKSYSALRQSALQAQTIWRCYFQKCVYLRLRISVQTIQKYTRGMLVRQHLKRQQRASLIIQCYYRGHHVRLMILKQNNASLVIQALWRGFVEQKRLVELLSNKLVLIQSHMRRYLARKHFQESLVAARVIQRSWRHSQKVMSMKVVEVLDELAILIQSQWRRTLAQKAYMNRKKASLSAACVIQKYWRSALARDYYLYARSSAIMIQCLARGVSLRMEIALWNTSAIQIQRHWRGLYASKQYLMILNTKEENHSASKIQAHWRMRQVIFRFERFRLSAVKIQGCWRGYSVWKKSQALLKKRRNILDDAARKIQVTFIIWKMHLAVMEIRSSVIILQRCIRGQLPRSAARFALEHINTSFQNATISSFARVVASTDRFHIQTLSAWYSAVNQARNFASIVIQSAVRRMLAQRAVMMSFGIEFETSMCLDQSIIEEESTCAVIIQTAFRNWRDAKASKSTQQVVKLQSLFRGCLARRMYAAMKERFEIERINMENAAIQIQRLIRGLIVKRKVFKSRKIAEEKVHNAYVKLIERVEKSSEDIVDQILNGCDTDSFTGPCFKRLVERVVDACKDAAEHSTVPTPNSPLADFIARKASTPVRCNRTQGQHGVLLFDRSNAEESDPFGDNSTNMPSPIKKQEDGDWEDSW